MSPWGDASRTHLRLPHVTLRCLHGSFQAGALFSVQGSPALSQRASRREASCSHGVLAPGPPIPHCMEHPAGSLRKRHAPSSPPPQKLACFSENTLVGEDTFSLSSSLSQEVAQ